MKGGFIRGLSGAFTCDDVVDSLVRVSTDENSISVFDCVLDYRDQRSRLSGTWRSVNTEHVVCAKRIDRCSLLVGIQLKVGDEIQIEWRTKIDIRVPSKERFGYLAQIV